MLCCFFFCQETIYGIPKGSVCVSLSCIKKYQCGLSETWWLKYINNVTKLQNRRNNKQASIVIVLLWNKHLVKGHFGTLILTSPEIKLNCCFKGKAVINSFLEQFLWVICLRKFIRYQTLDLSRVGHACQPKLVCSGHMFLFTCHEFLRQPKFMRYWINHNATVKTKTVCGTG